MSNQPHNVFTHQGHEPSCVSQPTVWRQLSPDTSLSTLTSNNHLRQAGEQSVEFASPQLNRFGVRCQSQFLQNVDGLSHGVQTDADKIRLSLMNQGHESVRDNVYAVSQNCRPPSLGHQLQDSLVPAGSYTSMPLAGYSSLGQSASDSDYYSPRTVNISSDSQGTLGSQHLHHSQQFYPQHHPQQLYHQQQLPQQLYHQQQQQPTQQLYQQQQQAQANHMQLMSQPECHTHQCNSISNRRSGVYMLESSLQRPLSAFTTAADNIEYEKNAVIEGQKMKILELEARLLNIGSSGRCAGRMTTSSQSQSSLPRSGLYYTSNTVLSSDELLTLKAELGAAEYELEELKQSSAAEVKLKDKVIGDLNKKIEEKDTELRDWSSKCKALSSQLEEEKAQSQRKDRYLDKLPTAQEHEKNIKTIAKLQSSISAWKTKSEETSKKLEQLKKSVDSRDSLIKQFEIEQEKSRSEIKELERCKKELEERLTLRPDLVQIQVLRGELDQLQTFADNITKALESERKNWTEREKKLKESLAASEQSANQESECVTTLRTEIERWAEQFKNCKHTVKQISEERDGWMERCLKEEEKVREVESVVMATADRRLLGQLMTDLGRCFSKLNVLISISLQLCAGDEPDISALLGLQDTSTSSSLPPTAGGGIGKALPVGNVSVNQWLDDLRRMMKDVDRLREAVSNRVAEDYGRRLTCSQQ